MKIVKPSVTLLSHTPQPLELIERCGRICYQSEPADLTPNGAVIFIAKLIKRGHESVLEHASFTFLIICDRGVTHELVRHRIASYSQESTRYCNYGGGILVIEPPGLSDYQGEWWKNATTAAENAYTKMLADGCTPQIARSVLPNCLKTQIAVTMNARELRHFLRLRTAKAAHPQMQEIAGMIRNVVSDRWPVLVEDIN